MANASIIVVEDDPRAGELIKTILEAEHYKVSIAKSALQGRSLVEKAPPDLLILDRTLPDKDGLDLCRELRADARFAALPILFLTGRKSVSEKVVGLKLGGDDYLAKPYSPEELVVRVEVLLRRAMSGKSAASVVAAGPIVLDAESRLVRIDGKEIGLTTMEFDLLRAFVERPERVLSRAFLLSHVWGYDLETDVNTKAVNVMIMGLRKKLGKYAEAVESVKNFGYRFRPPLS